MFSFQVKVSPENMYKHDDESEPVRKERLVLAPFNKPPRIEFKNVPVGSTVKHTLTLENPSDLPTEVELYNLPPEERGVTLGSTLFQLKPYEEVDLEITWCPAKEGNWREVVRLRASGSLKLEFILLLSSLMPGVKGTKQSQNVKLQSSTTRVSALVSKRNGPSNIKKHVKWNVTKSPKNINAKRNMNKIALQKKTSLSNSTTNASVKNIKQTRSMETLLPSESTNSISTRRAFNHRVSPRKSVTLHNRRGEKFVPINTSYFNSCDVASSPLHRQTYLVPRRNKENVSPVSSKFRIIGEESSLFLTANSGISSPFSSVFDSPCDSFFRVPGTPSFSDSKKNCSDSQASFSTPISRMKNDLFDFQFSPFVKSEKTLQAVVKPSVVGDSLNRSLDKLSLHNSCVKNDVTPSPKSTENDSLERIPIKRIVDCFENAGEVDDDSLEKFEVKESNDSVMSDFVCFKPDERSTPEFARPLTPVQKDTSTPARVLDLWTFGDTPFRQKNYAHFPIAEEDEDEVNTENVELKENLHTASETSKHDADSHLSSDTFILPSPCVDVKRPEVVTETPASKSNSTGCVNGTDDAVENLEMKEEKGPEVTYKDCAVSVEEQKPDVTVLNQTSNPVVNSEEELVKKLNSILMPFDGVFNNSEPYYASAEKLWIETEIVKQEIVNEQLEVSLLSDIRPKALALFESSEFSEVVIKIGTYIDSEFLKIRENNSLYKNSELKCYVLELLLNYEPVWLLVGLEILFNKAVPLVYDCIMRGIVIFIKAHLLHDDVPQNVDACSTDSEIESAVNKFILKKFLTLVCFLDIAKRKRIIKHNPCLFSRYAKHKASLELLITFSSKFLTENDQNLKCVSHVLHYFQSYLDEFDYSVKNLTCDFCDGIRLVRLSEILTQRNTLSAALNAPAVTYVEKIQNVNHALIALKNGGFAKPSEITSDDIVTGDKRKIMTFLCSLIDHYNV